MKKESYIESVISRVQLLQISTAVPLRKRCWITCYLFHLFIWHSGCFNQFSTLISKMCSDFMCSFSLGSLTSHLLFHSNLKLWELHYPLSPSASITPEFLWCLQMSTISNNHAFSHSFFKDSSVNPITHRHKYDCVNI